MARWVLVSFLVVCLLCLAQAFPQSATPTQSPTDQIKAGLNNAMETLQKGIQSIIEDPNLAKIVKDGQKALETAAQTISSEAAKIIPKTE